MRGCESCHWAGLPNRDVCPRCHGRRWREVDSRDGEITACTSVARAFGVDMEPARYYAIVTLKDGGTVVTHNPDQLAVGTPVTVEPSMTLSTR